jgi:hypothetical protein
MIMQGRGMIARGGAHDNVVTTTKCKHGGVSAREGIVPPSTVRRRLAARWCRQRAGANGGAADAA